MKGCEGEAQMGHHLLWVTKKNQSERLGKELTGQSSLEIKCDMVTLIRPKVKERKMSWWQMTTLKQNNEF